MLNGMEQMIVNVLGGMGIDVDVLMKRAFQLMETVETKLNSIDERMTRIEKALNIIPDDELKQIVIEKDNDIAEAMHDHVN